MAKLKAGVTVEEEIDSIRVISSGKGNKAVDIKNCHTWIPNRYASSIYGSYYDCGGTSTVTETVFENRFMHVAELRKMGRMYR